MAKVSKTSKNNVTSQGTRDTPRFPNLHNWSETPEIKQYDPSGVLMPSGFKTGEDAPPNDTDKYVLIKQSGVDPNQGDPSDSIIKPEQNGTDTGIHKDLSNAYQSRQDALSKGLYNASVFNPYIHYGDGREIAYQENYEAAARYLDPYSDAYVFQTSLSESTFTGSSTATTTPAPSPEPSPGIT